MRVDWKSVGWSKRNQEGGLECPLTLPICILSDRGPQFTAEFTTELYRLLGIKAAKTTAYHPQADGQTERVNQELEQYLWLFTSERQDDWADLLSMAEFQYNNHIHSQLSKLPFFLTAANTLGWVSN
jgi:transposase InsO family protein